MQVIENRSSATYTGSEEHTFLSYKNKYPCKVTPSKYHLVLAVVPTRNSGECDKQMHFI